MKFVGVRNVVIWGKILVSLEGKILLEVADSALFRSWLLIPPLEKTSVKGYYQYRGLRDVARVQCYWQ